MTLEERIRQIAEARRIDRACQEMIMQKVEEARQASPGDLERVSDWHSQGTVNQR